MNDINKQTIYFFFRLNLTQSEKKMTKKLKKLQFVFTFYHNFTTIIVKWLVFILISCCG